MKKFARIVLLLSFGLSFNAMADLKLAENLRPLLTLEAKTRTLFAPKEAAPSGSTNPHSGEEITFFPIDIDEHAHHSPS